MKTSITLTLEKDPVRFASAVLGWKASSYILPAIRETQQGEEVSLQKARDYLQEEIKKYQNPSWDGGGFFNPPTQEQRGEKISDLCNAQRDLEKLSHAIGGDIEPADLP